MGYFRKKEEKEKNREKDKKKNFNRYSNKSTLFFDGKERQFRSTIKSEKKEGTNDERF